MAGKNQKRGDATGAAGTTDQKPNWEGPPETRPSGYLPADDNPEIDRDAAGENLQDPDRSGLGGALKTRDSTSSREDQVRQRAHQIWENQGRPSGAHVEHWQQAEREVDEGERSIDHVKRALSADTPDDLEGPKAGARRTRRP